MAADPFTAGMNKHPAVRRRPTPTPPNHHTNEQTNHLHKQASHHHHAKLARKRCFVDPRHPISDLANSPPSKKPKIQSQPQPQPSDPNPTSASIPPPAPLPRPVHGPQRAIKAFNLGSSRKGGDLRQDSRGMGNFISGFLKSKRGDGLGLEEYKNLVNESGTRKAEGTRLGLLLVEGISPGLDTTEAKDTRVLNRKVGDARSAVEESIGVREEKDRVQRGPVYKDLYGKAKKYDTRLQSLDFELRLAEKKVSGFRSMRKALEEKPKEDLHALFSPLTDEEEDEVSRALHGGNRRELLIAHKPSNIEITRELLQCLSYGAWLNDEVINLYLELLKERERREPQMFLKCHFFNTFFYKRLISGRNGYDFNAVKRWTTKRKLGYGLIECDKIFVPIHKDIHWCLAVINVKDETFQYLDSLGGMDTTVLRVLARYFMDETKDKSNKQIDTTCWKHVVVDDLPQQQNGFDCGMFMLKYADFYSRGLGLCFSQEHMDYFRKKTAKEILKLRAE